MRKNEQMTFILKSRIVLLSTYCVLAVFSIFAVHELVLRYGWAQMEVTTDTESSVPVFNETFSESDEPKPVISNSKLFTNSFSSSIVGEVLNNFTYPIESVQVSASVYDKNNIIIATDSSYTSDDQIKPGEKSGFDIYLGDKVPKSSKYVLETNFEESEDTKEPYLKLNVGKKSKDSFSFKIVGEVTNLGLDDANSVKVSGIFYDKSHNVVATDYAYTEVDPIPPGRKAPFELSTTDNVDKINSIGLNVQSSDYSLISNNGENRTNSLP